MKDIAAYAAAQASSDGFSLGTLLLFVGGAILLAFFCSIGLIARLRENRLQERREATRTRIRSEGGHGPSGARGPS